MPSPSRRPNSYDPATGTWSYTGDLVSPQMNHGAVTLTDGRVLIAGGAVKGGNGTIPTNAAQIYDPATATWTTTGSMRGKRDSLTLQLLPDGRVLAATGTHGEDREASATAEIYDPATGLWTRTGNLGVGTFNQIDASLPDGSVLVAGGDNDRVYALRGAEVFDPVTETWSRAGRMSTDRKSAAAASLADGSVLVVGGLSFNNGVLKTADRYLPERNR